METALRSELRTRLLENTHHVAAAETRLISGHHACGDERKSGQLRKSESHVGFLFVGY